ncbi:hypothetical protein FisN_38Lh024 [Fistulifera solaris]|uniref:SAC domain-containing protein n=1 Tax=Fistulifera solaris TaxID=1519565 RepID=A0A1Z5J6I0_FISSO|nr:hypothetical protein FisN_38Lh024 [Fistulifera solaris]|eukprot:GAX09603.1 hypothetical protein FisN_38Lh024 [Fistulifera solaris]
MSTLKVQLGRSLVRNFLLKIFVQFGLVIIWLIVASSDSRLYTEANGGQSVITSLPTRVTGFGSRRYSEISSTHTAEKEGVTKLLSLYTNSDDKESIIIHSKLHNATLKILPDGSVIHDDPSNPVPTTNINEKWSNIIGLFGVYKVPSGHIWVWIAGADCIYEAPYLLNQTSNDDSDRQFVPWWSLYRVTQLHLTHLPFSNYSTAHASTRHYRAQEREEKRQLALLRQALKDHDWYFSEGPEAGDLTRRLQDLLSSQKEQIDGDDITKELPDERFFWNQAVVDPIVEKNREENVEISENNVYRILLEHVIPTTSAFCGTQTNVSVASDGSFCVYDQVLVTRRSRFRAGTRFTRRGADATGAVANFAETEQILFFWHHSEGNVRVLDNVCSHVQTRGSIPLRWSSPTDIKTYRPRVRIGTNPLAHARALRQHLLDQARYFAALWSTTTDAPANPSLLLVNLVDKNSDQGRLGRAFDAVLKAILDVYAEQPDRTIPWLAPGYIKHLWFDFHAEVKAGGWERLSSLLDAIAPVLDQHGYFEAVPLNETLTNNQTSSSFKVKRVQAGVVRTNCMDCLDRTNVVQSQLARHVLFSQVAGTSKIPVSYKAAFRKKTSALPWLTGEVAHRLLWADNADAISRLYAGTPALKGDFTRTGKRTKKGALEDGMNSLQRYYLNNFLDADRQEGIDLLTGHHPFNKLASLLDDFCETRSTETIEPIVSGFARSAKNNLLAGSSRTKRLPRSFAEKTTLTDLPFKWLPGDLQSHVAVNPQRQQSSSMKTSRAFAFEGVHRRAAELLPWWCGDGEKEVSWISVSSDSALTEAEISALNNAGYLMGALAVGLHRPQSLAVLVALLVELTIIISGTHR